MSKDIAQLAGIKRRAVDVFLQTLETAGLIENPRGKPPKKILDYVPPSWLELVKVEESKEENKERRRFNK